MAAEIKVVSGSKADGFLWLVDGVEQHVTKSGGKWTASPGGWTARTRAELKQVIRGAAPQTDGTLAKRTPAAVKATAPAADETEPDWMGFGGKAAPKMEVFGTRCPRCNKVIMVTARTLSFWCGTCRDFFDYIPGADGKAEAVPIEGPAPQLAADCYSHVYPPPPAPGTVQAAKPAVRKLRVKVAPSAAGEPAPVVTGKAAETAAARKAAKVAKSTDAAARLATITKPAAGQEKAAARNAKLAAKAAAIAAAAKPGAAEKAAMLEQVKRAMLRAWSAGGDDLVQANGGQPVPGAAVREWVVEAVAYRGSEYGLDEATVAAFQALTYEARAAFAKKVFNGRSYC